MWINGILAGCTAVLVFALLAVRRRIGRLVAESAGAQARLKHGALFAGRLAALPDALFLVDRNGRTVSPFGDHDPADAIGVAEHLPPDMRDEFFQHLAEVSATGRRTTYRARSCRSAFQVSLTPLATAGGGDPQIVVQLHDVSEAERAHARLRKLAERNQAILRSSMDGFFVVGEDYRFVEVNDAFCRMTGYTREELLEKRISELEVDEPPHDGLPSHTRTGLHQFPTAHRHRDGHVIFLEISVNVHHTVDGKILVGFARDVTERRRAAEEFARLGRLHRLILDSAQGGIHGVDREGRTTFVNAAAAKMLGASAGELIGQPAHRMCASRGAEPGPCTEHDCPLCAVLRSGICRLQTESEFEDSDGRVFPVEFSITPMYEANEVIGAVIVFRDVTDRKQAESERRTLEMQIQQVQRLESLGLLAGGIAHDLNNMLVGILGNACLAMERADDEAGVRDRLQRIVNASERASKVISQILAYSGRVTCDPSPEDLNELVTDMADFMRAGVPSTVELKLVLHPNLPLIEADNGQMQQVITNLLVNSIEAIGEDVGRIVVATDCVTYARPDLERHFPAQELGAGRYVTLSVSDTGCGIEPERLNRIFEPFYSEKGAGRGLGLSAMHGIVRAHEGGVRVESTPGAGTTVTVIFPVNRSIEHKKRPQAEQPRVAPGATVLVVDDEEDVREVVKDILEMRGLRVLTAADGDRGIELFRKEASEVDVVLLDMTMPGMNGSDVFREIVKIAPDAKVIISSGFSERNIATRFDQARPAGFVHKPFTTETLVEKIGGVLCASTNASGENASAVDATAADA